MNYLPFILCFLLILFPLIYLAGHSFFFFTPNKKRNSFIIRLFFLTPGTLIISFGFCVFVWSIFFVFFENFSYSVYNIFGYYSLLPLPLFVSSFLLLFSKKYILRKDIPPEFQSDFFDYDLYVYMPSIREVDDRPAVKIHSNTASISQLVNGPDRDLVLNCNDLPDKNILFTKYGGIIINNFASSIFETNNLTGYRSRPIFEKKTISPSNIYMHIISSSLPPLSPLTKITKAKFPYRSLVKNDQVYYNSTILKEASDFNRSFEYFGSNSILPYPPQRLWIVSNKAMKVLINELNQNKRDFIPVHLVDDENPELEK